VMTAMYNRIVLAIFLASCLAACVFVSKACATGLSH
jgi:chemotaxis receptor (MCP) glutamine deamidase CheD